MHIEPIAATPSQRLAETLIGQSMREWIGTRRAAGLSWRKIAAELREATGGQVDVTGQSLLNWMERAA